MTNCAGAIIRQNNRKVNKYIKISISSKKYYHRDHKSIVTIYDSCKWDKIKESVAGMRYWSVIWKGNQLNKINLR